MTKIKIPKIKLTFTTVIIIGLIVLFVILGINMLIRNIADSLTVPSNTQGLPRDSLGDAETNTTDNTSQGFDPANSDYSSDTTTSLSVTLEPISITLLEYISITNPSTDNYSLYIDGNQAIVVLKNGYTQQLFEADFLSRFTNVGDAQIVYVDESTYKDLVP